MSREKIMIVEDEEGIRGLMQLYLENRGYTVVSAENGEKALEIVSGEKPQLVLLDIEMPGISGFDVCRQMRGQQLDFPIIFVSSRSEVMDKVKCFELGADDYITKPFDFAEMEARIKAILRRSKRSREKPSGMILKQGELEIHLDTYECFLNGHPLSLTTKEMKLLILLATSPNRVFSAEQIYDQIWGMDSIGNVQTVKVHIRNLRNKVESDPSCPKHIQTYRGFGYKFVN